MEPGQTFLNGVPTCTVARVEAGVDEMRAVGVVALLKWLPT
jgi:hypothetical protein